MRFAPSRTRELSWREGEDLKLLLPAFLLHATVFPIPQTNVLHLEKSVSPPLSPSSFGKRLFGLLRKFLGLLSLCVLFGFKFLVSSYKKESCEACPSSPPFRKPQLPMFAICPSAIPKVWGFGVSKEVFLGIKLPQLGFSDRRLAFGLKKGTFWGIRVEA